MKNVDAVRATNMQSYQKTCNFKEKKHYSVFLLLTIYN